MRGLFLAIFVCVIGVVAVGQPLQSFSALMETAPDKQSGKENSALNAFIEDLQHKKARVKSDEEFIHFAFRETHKRFLKTYQAYAQFPELLNNGKYDCLTATSFLSVLLTHFDYQYQIIETNYHIFLIVETSTSRILLESTDKANGFVTGASQINNRIKHYSENSLTAAASDKYYYEYSLDLYRTIQPQQLVGLLYYNQAVIAFNDQRYKECVIALKKSVRIYNSPRINELAELVLKSVANSDLSESDKKSIIKPILPFVQNNQSVVAAR
jgi:hypothetical protein